jgi:hypothetical protein
MAVGQWVDVQVNKIDEITWHGAANSRSALQNQLGKWIKSTIVELSPTETEIRVLYAGQGSAYDWLSIEDTRIALAGSKSLLSAPATDEEDVKPSPNEGI